MTTKKRTSEPPPEPPSPRARPEPWVPEPSPPIPSVVAARGDVAPAVVRGDTEIADLKERVATIESELARLRQRLTGRR